MSLRYGIPAVDPDRRICYNCQHFLVNIDSHQGWGECELAKNDGLFRNHAKGHVWMAKHTNSRYYTTTGCKKRFKAVKEG